MSYSVIEEECKDIDWFCIIDKYPIHVASAGGILPEIIKKEKKINQKNRKIIKNASEYCDYKLNPKLKNIISKYINPKDESHILAVLEALNLKSNKPIDTYIEKVYAHSFIEFAKKGFYSFDKSNINDPNDGKYHLVASPSKLITNEIISELPNIQTDDFNLQNESFDLIAFINRNTNDRCRILKNDNL